MKTPSNKLILSKGDRYSTVKKQYKQKKQDWKTSKTDRAIIL